MGKYTFFNRKTVAFFFPSKEIRLFFLLLLFKICWFDCSWCMISTFRPFSYAETYVFGILLALLLLLPFVLLRRAFIAWITDLALGCLLVSNLLYFRTYSTAIPLSSYGLADNLKDFTDSVTHSLRWEDSLFLLSTAVAYFIRLKIRRGGDRPRTAGRYLLTVSVFVLFAGALLLMKGGFKKSYERLQDSYTHTCGPPVYTVFGSAYYDYIRDREIYTPEVGRHIEGWMSEHAASEADPPFIRDARVSCVLIIAESLESWVLEQHVEGQELTPCMNRLLRDSTTLYAPRVLSQVKGGRSIDAQLIFNAGLLPIETGAYSLKYPHTRFPSLAKAMKEKYGGNASACMLTADKPLVWNQEVMASAFGYDSLLSKSNFIQDEIVGPHYRHQLGDVSLLRQSVEKIRAGEVWKGAASLVQIVTYSGHFPFTIPEHLKALSFSGYVPALMRDYMTVANYTDHAIGLFVEALRSDPQYDHTLIVITGDHEGLADRRNELCRNAAGQGVVSEDPFTPLIIVNIPPSLRPSVSGCMRYENVMGQIDIYPTLLELLGLTAYEWKGLGQSILHPDKKGIAVDAHNRICGDTANIPAAYIRFIEDAWKVSDEMIRYDYLGQ
jgi:phosphoglycerol transferase MdoB-like AlkP superfamily enzyme